MLGCLNTVFAVLLSAWAAFVFNPDLLNTVGCIHLPKIQLDSPHSETISLLSFDLSLMGMWVSFLAPHPPLNSSLKKSLLDDSIIIIC
jgi:hypothetical protein